MHVYVHVPFCARRCSYCDFAIAVRPRTPIDEFLNSLERELDLRTKRQKLTEVSTVYFGGGTPSRLGGDGIARALSLVRNVAEISRDAEITIEANPDDVHDISVAHWAHAGVNRVSLGAQSFDDTVLTWMHRTHNARSISRAVQVLRRGGIANISLDLIFAVPPQLQRSWERDIELTLDLVPSHISLYGLTVEPHTPIGRWRDRGIVVEGSEDSYEKEFLYAHETLRSAGYDHYEVSNFARPGLRARHNSSYWSSAPYLGVGPSAHSFDGAVRRWNVPAYVEWNRRLAEGGDVIQDEERLTTENRSAEKIYLGLRTTSGLTIAPAELEIIRRWVDAGWATVDSGRVFLTGPGWLRLDSLAADLAARRERTASLTSVATPSHCYI